MSFPNFPIPQYFPGIFILNAGYVEKPLSVDALSANRMTKVAKEKKGRLCVAHYRRAQPLFKKIKELLVVDGNK